MRQRPPLGARAGQRWVTRSSCCRRRRCGRSCAATRTTRPTRGRSGWPRSKATSGACRRRAPSSRPCWRCTARDQHWVSVRTATVNALRGLLYEFGVVLRGGRASRAEGAGRAARGDRRAGARRRCAAGGRAACTRWSRSSSASISSSTRSRRCKSSWPRRCELRQVPGIGVLGATALAATLGDGKAWRTGREFSASLGLVPAHSGTGGKVRIGAHLQARRPVPAHAADSRRARGDRARQGQAQVAASRLLARRPLNVVVVALANKMARTAWALVAHGRAYQRDWQERQARVQHRASGGCVDQPHRKGVDAAKSA